MLVYQRVHVSEGISQGVKDEKSTLNGNEYKITLDNLNLLWKKWRHTHFTAELKFLFVSTMERSQDVYLEEQKVTCLNLCWPMRGWVKTLRPTMTPYWVNYNDLTVLPRWNHSR